jgi:hypothetical protein
MIVCSLNDNLLHCHSGHGAALTMSLSQALPNRRPSALPHLQKRHSRISPDHLRKLNLRTIFERRSRITNRLLISPHHLPILRKLNLDVPRGIGEKRHSLIRI